jgi:Arc/MetJ-type ribon-helix-helix transcriptional regulator
MEKQEIPKGFYMRPDLDQHGTLIDGFHRLHTWQQIAKCYPPNVKLPNNYDVFIDRARRDKEKALHFASRYGFAIDTETSKLSPYNGIALSVGQNYNYDLVSVMERAKQKRALLIDTLTDWNELNKKQINNSNMEKKTIDVEKLIANAGKGIASEVIKDAIAEVKKEADKEQKARVIQQIVNIQANTAIAVEQLRKARAIEKKTKEYLQFIADAEQAFYKDADIKAYDQKIASASSKIYGWVK